MSTRRTELLLHLGAQSPGDITEANLLTAAIAHWPESPLRCECIVHQDADHGGVAAHMKRSGALHQLLCDALRSGESATSTPVVARDGLTNDATRGPHSSLPDQFVGFADCPDF
jgi:hypothetical protein